MSIFSKRPPGYKAGVILLFLATVTFFVGFVSPFWISIEDKFTNNLTQQGLWMRCGTEEEFSCTLNHTELFPAIASEDDLANGLNSVRLERSVHRERSGDGVHWRGITHEDNGYGNKQKRGKRGLPSAVVSAIQNLANANQKFSVSMYRLLEVNNSNFVFSPHSVHMALSLTSIGATELTAKEMLQVLGVEKIEKKNVHLAYGTLLMMNLANAVLANSSFAVSPQFTADLMQFYKAQFGRFYFDSPGGPEAPINQMMSELTAGNIPNALQSGSLQRSTSMVILNVFYFKGTWWNKFNRTLTTEQDFYVTKDIKVTVPMMNRVGSYKYKESSKLKARILDLPLENNQYSMYIILPIKRNELDDVIKRMTCESLIAEIRSVRAKKVNVFLPKFKLESDLKLKTTLINMGMVKAFSKKDATFKGISIQPGLYISDVYHKAVIEVTEEGREADAATAAVSDYVSIMKPFDFQINHPFLYIIIDTSNQVVLFMGKYSGQK